MNKKLLTLAIVALVMPTSVLAIKPQYSHKFVTEGVDFHGFEVTENKWYVLYNGNLYELNIYTSDNLLYGWNYSKDGEMVSETTFLETQPYCEKTFDKGEVNEWECEYNGHDYLIRVLAQDHILNGWQIFQDGKLIRNRHFH